MVAARQFAIAVLGLAAAAAASARPMPPSQPEVVDTICAADEFCCGFSCLPKSQQAVTLCPAIFGGCSRGIAPTPLGEEGPQPGEGVSDAPGPTLAEPGEASTNPPQVGGEREGDGGDGVLGEQPDGCPLGQFCCGFECRDDSLQASIPCLRIFGGCLMRGDSDAGGPMDGEAPLSDGAAPLGGDGRVEAPSEPPLTDSDAAGGGGGGERDDCCGSGTFCCGSECIEDRLAPIVRCAYIEGGCCSAQPVDDNMMGPDASAGGYGDDVDAGGYAMS